MAYVALAHREIGVKNGFSKSKYMYIQIKAFHVKVQSCIYKGTNPQYIPRQKSNICWQLSYYWYIEQNISFSNVK